jgi:hypothetical protein
MKAKHQNRVPEDSSHDLKGKTLKEISSKSSQPGDRPGLLNQVG